MRSKINKNIVFTFVIIIITLFQPQGYGQITKSTLLKSPHECIYNHLFYLQNEQYDVDLSSHSFRFSKTNKSAVEDAIRLKRVLDGRGLFVFMSTIPDEENYIDSTTNKSIFVPFPKELPEVYLQKKDSQWTYSEETSSQISTLYKETYPFGSYRLIDYFGHQNNQNFLGLPIWQIVAVLLMIMISFLLYKLLSLIIHKIYSRITNTKYNRILSFDKENKLSNPISVMIILFLIRLFLPILQLNIKWSAYAIIGLNIAISVIIGLVLFRLIDVLVYYLNIAANKTESKLDEQLMPMLKRLLKIIVFIVTTMYVLNLLDVNITALIAGVSIGGLALALAAQDTVKNLIGSLMIFLDAPFQIGDYIQVNGMAGTVVEVGFRSTKIITSDSSIITIPNGTLSSTSMTNKGMRTHRLFNTTLTLNYNTTPAKIKQFISGLRSIIEEHKYTMKEGYYVHLINLNSSSIDILFRVSLITTAYDQELIIKENLLFSIIELAEKLTIDFAFPSQTVYLNKE